MREKVLISACLAGINCKFNGENNLLDSGILDEISKKYHLLFVCPEVFGGLSTPREPAEMKDGLVVTKTAKDVSENFKFGAEICLKIEERKFSMDEVYAADEVFISAATLILLPVIYADGKAINGAKVGEISSKLREIYASELLKEAGL